MELAFVIWGFRCVVVTRGYFIWIFLVFCRFWPIGFGSLFSGSGACFYGALCSLSRFLACRLIFLAMFYDFC